jgi:hypothetical protein
MVDTGTNATLIRESDSHLLLNLAPAQTPIIVKLANGQSIRSTHVGTLNYPSLPPKAREAHVFGDSDLLGNLFTVHNACDAGCTVTFDKTSIRITSAEGTTLLEGRRKNVKSMWMLNLDNESHRANSAATEPAAKAESAPVRE